MTEYVDYIEQLSERDRDELGLEILPEKRRQINSIIGWMLEQTKQRVEEIRVASSSGSSTVLIPIKEDRSVYQWFRSKKVIESVVHIARILTGPVTYTYNIRRGIRILSSVPITWNIDQYIVEFKYTIPDDNLIVWEKMITLNSIPKEDLPYFIFRNIRKIVWDLGKSLFSIHSKELLHNDATLDNTGINGKNGNFCYFDFDGSKPLEYQDKIKDQRTLVQSFDFYLENSSLTDEEKQEARDIYSPLGYDFIKSSIDRYIRERELEFSTETIQQAVNYYDSLRIF